jgi:hypothetical protein
MTLIEEFQIEYQTVKFYEGIDFEMIHNYKEKDFLIFFINSWKEEIIKWKRDSKLNTLLYNDDYSCFDVHNIENNFVSIYQVGDNLSVVIDVVKKRIINRQDHTLFPYKIRDIV